MAPVRSRRAAGGRAARSSPGDAAGSWSPRPPRLTGPVHQGVRPGAGNATADGHHSSLKITFSSTFGVKTCSPISHHVGRWTQMSPQVHCSAPSSKDLNPALLGSPLFWNLPILTEGEWPQSLARLRPEPRTDATDDETCIGQSVSGQPSHKLFHTTIKAVSSAATEPGPRGSRRSRADLAIATRSCPLGQPRSLQLSAASREGSPRWPLCPLPLALSKLLWTVSVRDSKNGPLIWAQPSFTAWGWVRCRVQGPFLPYLCRERRAALPPPAQPAALLPLSLLQPRYFYLSWVRNRRQAQFVTSFWVELVCALQLDHSVPV